MKLKDHCNECGSVDVEWQLSLTVPSGVPQNRLNTHDIVPVFFLACNCCSETVQTVKQDAFMQIVNQSL